MKFAHANVDRSRGARRRVFASRAFDGSRWLLAVVLLGTYCGLRASGEIERRAAIAAFFHRHGAPIAAELAIVEPRDLAQR